MTRGGSNNQEPDGAADEPAIESTLKKPTVGSSRFGFKPPKSGLAKPKIDVQAALRTDSNPPSRQTTPKSTDDNGSTSAMPPPPQRKNSGRTTRSSRSKQSSSNGGGNDGSESEGESNKAKTSRGSRSQLSRSNKAASSRLRAAGNSQVKANDKTSGLESAKTSSLSESTARLNIADSTALPENVETIENISKSVFGDDFANTIEGVLQVSGRFKAAKFNYKARIEEQTQYIRELRQTLKDMLDKKNDFTSKCQDVEAQLSEHYSHAKQLASEAQAEIDSIALHRKSLQAEVTRLEDALTDQEETVKQMEAQVETAKTLAQDSVERLSVVEEAKLALEQELSETKSEVATSQKNAERLESELAIQIEKIAHLSKESEEAQAEMNKAFEKREEELKATLETEKTELTQKIEELTQQIEQLEGSRVSLESQIAKTQGEKEKLEEQLEESKQAKAASVEALQKKDIELTEWKSKLAEKDVENAQAMSGLKSEKLQVEAKLQEAQSRITELEYKTKEQDKEHERLQGQLRQQEIDIGELKATMAKKDMEVAQEASNVRLEKMQLQSSLQEMISKAAELEFKIEQLKKDSERATETLGRKDTEIEELKARLGKKEEEVAQALGGLAQAQSFAQISSSKLEAERAAIEEARNKDRERISELQVEATKIKSDMEKFKTENEVLKAKLEVTLKDNESARKEAMEHQTTAQEKDRAATVEKELRSMLENQMKDLRNEYTALNAQMQATKYEAERARERLDQEHKEKDRDWEAQIQALKTESEKLKATIKELEEKNISYQSELRTLNVASSHAQDTKLEELCEVNKELDILRQKLKDQEAQLRLTNEEKDKRLEDLEAEVIEGETKRRKLHNIIQELRGNVRVFVRTRPILPGDRSTDGKTLIETHPDGQGLKLAGSKGKEDMSFRFDKAFPPSTSQETIFKEVSEFVQSALDGYNVCLFSYGQTGSGKTHTMQGSGNGQMRGIIPRAIEAVMDCSETMAKQGWKYTMEVTFLEIYNETIRDLLAPRGVTDKKLEIKRSANSRPFVPDLERIEVKHKSQVESIMETAAKRRSVGVTDMNAESSRSHSVFTLHLRGENESQGAILEGALNLCDLAGSERLSKSGASGDRLKETQSINKSLSCLTDVFVALTNKSSHVPYRNSKLTYLLQPCLSGDGKTLMMVNLSPIEESHNESLCSLRFASQVNKCELGKPKRQVMSKKIIEDSKEETGIPGPATRRRNGRG